MNRGGRVELLWLRYFQAIARHEHISRAAGELQVAQPSVSRTLARLEAELGAPLFDRRGRQIRLNRFGAMFLRRVDRALAELDDGRRELADAAELHPGGVAVASETLLTLSDLLAAFRLRHPGVEVQLYQATAEVMAARLRAREVDLCLASQPLAGAAFDSVTLLDEEVLLAVPAGHALAGRDRVPVGALADQPFITTRPGHWMRTLLDRLGDGGGFVPRIVCEGDEPGALVQLVADGLGVTLVPAMGRRGLVGAPVAWLRLDTPHSRRVLDLVWRRDAYLTTAARQFRAAALHHFRAPGDR